MNQIEGEELVICWVFVGQLLIDSMIGQPNEAAGCVLIGLSWTAQELQCLAQKRPNALTISVTVVSQFRE